MPWWNHISSWAICISVCCDPWCCYLHIVSVPRRQIVGGSVSSCIWCHTQMTSCTAAFDLDMLAWTDVLSCSIGGWTVGHFSCNLNTWPIRWQVLSPTVNHASIVRVSIDVASKVGSIGLDIRLGATSFSLSLFGTDIGMDRSLQISVRLPEHILKPCDLCPKSANCHLAMSVISTSDFSMTAP